MASPKIAKKTPLQETPQPLQVMILVGGVIKNTLPPICKTAPQMFPKSSDLGALFGTIYPYLDRRERLRNQLQKTCPTSPKMIKTGYPNWSQKCSKFILGVPPDPST